jgi:hypothetical protein
MMPLKMRFVFNLCGVGTALMGALCFASLILRIDYGIVNAQTALWQDIGGTILFAVASALFLTLAGIDRVVSK